MTKEVIIFGTGGHAKVVHDIFQKAKEFTPVGFISLDTSIQNFLGLPVYNQGDFKNLKFTNGIIAIGDNWTRGQLQKFIVSEKPNFHFVNAIHPSVQVGNGVDIENGTVAMAGAIINPGSKIGAHVILNTNCSVDHDCILGNFSSIAPGAILGGNVIIGEYSAISLGAKIIHGKKIGTHSVIGAGALVLADIVDNVVAFGSPCKVIRNRAENEKYL
ncbi:MAG: acetyltransferase [Bacteriovorax sp.]|nr:acetyltransferase [Bacteriovorax sp.]